MTAIYPVWLEGLPLFEHAAQVDNDPLDLLRGLPQSKAVQRLDEMYGDDTTGRLLRECQQLDPPTRRIDEYGATALTDAELIGIVANVDDPTTPMQLLSHAQGLNKLAGINVNELAALPGMTAHRARRLVAAFELSRRVLKHSNGSLPIIKSPQDAANLLADMGALQAEQFRVMILNTKNHVLDVVTIYQGSVNTTVVRVAEILRPAIVAHATALILVHNHPSGDPTPSPEDVAVTSEIVKAAKLIDLDVLDHLVIGDGQRFVSLKERGLGF